MTPTNRPAVEIADVFRRYGPEFVSRYGTSLSTQQRKAIQDIERCRTAALGGHKEECNACGHEQYAYNSCRNRNCCKCQGGARAKWMAKREAELLPVEYLHVVFTLPQIMARLALQNKKVMYDILFQATSRTLLEVALNPKHLGARLGFFGVLHSWGQRMENHPHIHYVVPAGGVSRDGTHWVHCKRSRKRKKVYLAPVKILSQVFAGKFIELLRRAYRQGELSFYGRFKSLRRPGEFERFLDASVRHNWVVYVKRPFRNAECVLKYLARYTHRVAIANSRLLSIEDGKVTFRWKDYRNDGAVRVARLDAMEFMRRFLQHVLPKGVRRIRHFGIFSNRHRTQNLALCRQLLGVFDPSPTVNTDPCPQTECDEPAADQAPRCPACNTGHMVITERWDRGERGVLPSCVHQGLLLAWDTS